MGWGDEQALRHEKRAREEYDKREAKAAALVILACVHNRLAKEVYGVEAAGGIARVEIDQVSLAWRVEMQWQGRTVRAEWSRHAPGSIAVSRLYGAAKAIPITQDRNAVADSVVDAVKAEYEDQPGIHA
jgi:hypothetical protein